MTMYVHTYSISFIHLISSIVIRYSQCFVLHFLLYFWQHQGAVPPVLPHVMMGCGSKCTRPKLDSRFILDVNVNDDTLMPPSTPFIKIWRMRNNGGLVWPQGTQLVWIGGDRFSQALSVEMEVNKI